MSARGRAELLAFFRTRGPAMGLWTLHNMRARIRINTRDAFDIGEKTFSDSDLLGYLNDGIRFVASTDHAAYQPVVDMAIPAAALTLQLGAGRVEFVEEIGRASC